MIQLSQSPRPKSASELWTVFAAPLRGFLRSRADSEDDADDLLQEVFLRIHRQLPQLKDPTKLQGWVYRIARNVVIDYYRKRRPLNAPQENIEAEDPAGQDQVDLSSSLRRFIGELPPAYREPLVRHEFQGLALKDVAAELGLSLTATKSRVQRARHMLREMLDQCCRFEFDRRGRVIDAIPRAQCDCSPS